MVEKFPETVQVYYNRGVAMLGVFATAAAVAAYKSSPAESYGYGLGTMSSDGESLDQVITFSPKTGDTDCSYHKSDPNTNFGSQSLVLRVEEKRNGEWRLNRKYAQPAGFGEPESDPHSVSTTVSHTYPTDRLAKNDAKRPQQIVCSDGSNEISLPVRFPSR
jgi:hypothetical protein